MIQVLNNQCSNDMHFQKLEILHLFHITWFFNFARETLLTSPIKIEYHDLYTIK